MRTDDERYENIAHKCKNCGAKWAVRMRLSSGLPAYVGADTYLCPECKSQNTIMFTNMVEVEP